MGIPPTGTVTFMFTDIVGSTRHWQDDRAGMERSLATHDQILRDTIGDEGGYVFATGGDSFSAAFPTPHQALEAAASAQLGLIRQTWEGPNISVRIGIHTGHAEVRDGNYFGPQVGRCARIMSLAGASQTLVSGVTADLVVDELGDAMSLVDLGPRKLRGIDRPERLFELTHPDLPQIGLAEEPDTHPNHLPQPLTSFVGREAELAAITDLLGNSRLVTLTGSGGNGKTRLAIEAARAAADRFGDGVYMCELGSVIDDQVLTQIANTWNLRPGEGADLDHVIASFLAQREVLLVLDNCEHVLDRVTVWLASMLPTSPSLRVLATSRESLGVPGESVFAVQPLGLPEPGEAAGEAVTLFLDRLQSVRPGYEPTGPELEAIVRICRRLDGIPLGLELAAARMRSMGPVDLEGHLEESFGVLSGTKGSLPRQRTLEATIDWSYQTLDDQEADIFRSASVFSGGFDLAAIEAVAGSDEVPVWEVANLVAQLHDKSLVTVVPGASYRFRMLEPIQAFAAEQLFSRGLSDDRRSAHANYYRAFVAEQTRRLRGHEQRAAFAAITVDIDNIRAALRFMRDTGSTEEMLAMASDLVMYWSEASMQVEALELLMPVLQAGPEIDPTVLTKSWFTASMMAFNLTDPRSAEYGENAIKAAELGGRGIDLGWANLATALAVFGTTRRGNATDYLKTGMALVTENLDQAWWDPDWDAIFRDFAAVFVDRSGTIVESHEVVARAKAIGDEFIAAMGLIGAYPGGDTIEQDLEEAVRILDDLGFKHALGHALIYWGAMTKGSEDQTAGEAAVTRGASMLAEIGDIPCAIGSTADIVAYLTDQDQLELARQHLDFARRQARSDPDRFAGDTASMAIQVMGASADTEAAERLRHYLNDAETHSGGQVLDMVDDWMSRSHERQEQED